MAARRATWSTFGPPHAYVGSALRKNAGRSGSLYPVATLVWARMLLGERLRTIQLAGVSLALVGVVLMTR